MNAGGESPHPLRERLAALPATARAGALLAHVCACAAQLVGKEPEAIAPDASWTDLGFDSLRAVDLRSELAQTLALPLRSTLLFDQPQPKTLVAHLLEQLAFAPAAAPAAEAACAPMPAHDGIAITGAACRFPGGESLEAFWQLLANGGDAVAPIPRERFDADALFDPDPKATGKLYVREAALLRDLDRFDAAFFGISPREAEALDPQQRLLLEVAWHALEHANLTPASLASRRVGVWVGTRASEYFDSQTARTLADANAYQHSGNSASTAAGRLSYTFGFTGPCYAIDTACSGSLVAVHVAARALRAGECDVALVGGVNAIVDPLSMAGLCRARMLSRDGRCKTFDAAADGYGRGEGCGVVVLQRLHDAQREGRRVLAVVEGTAINQDGRSSGLTVPNGTAQVAVIRDALADARLPPDAIAFVEAHGTGTSLGDPIEIGALDAVFGRGRSPATPLVLGSVKTNIGHLEPAAGIAGLLKTVLALRARTLPRHLHCRTPNPHVDWAHSIVRIVHDAVPLRADGDLHAGVNSFGFSGTNCHVIVRSAPAETAPPAAAPVAAAGTGPWLLPLQAADREALRALAAAHADAVVREGTQLAAWCHAAAGRAALPVRAAFVASDARELAAALRAFATGDERAATVAGHAPVQPPRVAFLFPGQGAQRAGMGRELCADEPVFRDAIDAAARTIDSQLPAPLRELLFGGASAHLDRTDAAQPALCAWQLAMCALLRSVGVQPDHVLGHSIGDFAAAVAAGAMDGDDALRLCATRGRLMVDRCEPGGMLAVLAPGARWEHLLTEHPSVAIAVRNGPANTVLGGSLPELARVHVQLEGLGIASRWLATSHAFHTAAVDPARAPFAAAVAAVPLRAPDRAFVDGRAGAIAGASLATPAWWAAHLREPVHFARGVQTLAASGCSVWLELGANPMLAALVGDAAGPGVRVLCVQRTRGAGRASWLAALAELWALGVPVDLAAANRGSGAARATLPAYPFQRRRFWLAAPVAPAAPHRRGARTLLGEALSTSLLAPGQTLFANELAATSPPWLGDHKAHARVLLPLAGMLEMALAAEMAAGTALPLAARAATARTGCELGERALAIESLRTAAPGDATFVLRSRAGDGAWRSHFECTTGPSTAPAGTFDLAATRARCREPLTAAAFYARAEALHFQYGAAFRGVRSAWAGDGEALAAVELPAGLDAGAFVLHPALLDACLQAVLAALPAETPAFLPRRVQSLVVHRAGVARAWCHVRVRRGDGADRLVDYVLADDDGSVIAELQALQLVPADPARRRRTAAPDSPRPVAPARDSLSLVALARESPSPAAPASAPLCHVAWVPIPLGTARAPSARPASVGLAGWPALTHALCERLPAGTARVIAAEEVAHRAFDVVLWLAEPDAADDRDPLRAQERLLGGALALVRAAASAASPPRLGLVTHAVQAATLAPPAGVPHASTLLGVWRTIAHEHAALRPFAIDLDALVPAAAVDAHAQTLAAELAAAGDEPEVAWCGGERRARRVRRGAANADPLAPPDAPFHVRAAEYGSFEHLGVAPHTRRAPGAHEVELAMTAVALNFKDVLHARGLLREFAAAQGVHRASEQPLGLEGCGVVTALGAAVTHVRAGDLAVVLEPGCLASHVTVAGTSVFALPRGVDAFAAAGAPIAFATAYHALFERAAVRAGETVLVHAAAGGVGQMAVRLLRAAGCRVLATASRAKHALVRELGAEVVGDSRRADFARAVAAATGGRGVDVVLNTLTGDTIAASVASLARGGRFVELGKLGVWSDDRMRAERPDVAFCAYDLGDEVARDPALRPRLLERLRDALATGATPLPAPTVAPLAQLRAAFQHLASGASTGKVVVAMPPAAALRADRTYVLTGASGGIAPAIASALVDAGAKHLALLARGEIAGEWLAKLRERGCHVATAAVDVADRAALANALDAVRSQAPPLGGVVHAAGALADGMLAALTPEHAANALRAKVAGAIWLDELTAADPIAFFVLTSSMAATLGNPGQAAYAAANTFLDAFAAARRARGRPAVSIAFGPWDGGGMTGRLAEPLRARLRARGIAMLAPAVASRLLVEYRAAGNDLAVLPVSWTEWLAPFGDAVPPALQELRAQPRAAGRPAPVDLDALAPAERRAELQRVVRSQVAAALGFAGPEPLAHHVTFRDLGLDSLLAIEAKDRLERALGRALPATLLFDHPDVERLVAHLLTSGHASR